MLQLRNKDRIVQSELFVEAWNQATKEQKADFIRYFNQSIKDFDLRKWILKALADLEEYPVKILRKIASYSRIKNYSRLSKAQLLISLKEKGVTSDNSTYFS